MFSISYLSSAISAFIYINYRYQYPSLLYQYPYLSTAIDTYQYPFSLRVSCDLSFTQSNYCPISFPFGAGGFVIFIICNLEIEVWSQRCTSFPTALVATTVSSVKCSRVYSIEFFTTLGCNTVHHIYLWGIPSGYAQIHKRKCICKWSANRYV